MLERKMIFSMILFLFLGFFINVAISSAANVNQNIINSSTLNSSAKIVSSNSVSNNDSSSIINQTSKSASLNTTNIVIVNGLTVNMLKNGLL